jgi:hypothetical protein
MTYEETPMKILDRKDQVLRNKNISLVKVLWSDYSVEESSWELEESMRNKYPHLFVQVYDRSLFMVVVYMIT